MIRLFVLTVVEKEDEELTDQECEDICDFMEDKVNEIKVDIPHSTKVRIES